MSEGPQPLIDPELAARVVERALKKGGDFAEVFCEERAGFGLGVDESRVERVQRGAERGAGGRAIDGETTYFAHVDGVGGGDPGGTPDAVAAAARGEHTEPQALEAADAARPQEIATPPGDVPAKRKADLLRACDETARSAGDEIAQVIASYAEGRRLVTVANSDGRFVSDQRTRVRLGVQAVARREGRVETGFETLGGHQGFELVENGAAERTADRAAHMALTLLDADPAPAGAIPVVVGGGFGGVLFHEMTGHGLEADHIQKGASVYAGKLGPRVAPPPLDAYDDGRLPGEWGTDGIDDEGTPTQRTAVIHQGRITSYLYDLMRARKDGVDSTGNGRRESFRHLPIPRMTNTYFAPGEATADELIGGVERGLYAVSFGGGQVEPATGDFVFGVSEGYLIENGRVTAPVRGATLVGNGLEALRAIDGIAGDLDIATGFCGKAGQSVPAGVGQPHVRIRELTVGGTA